MWLCITIVYWVSGLVYIFQKAPIFLSIFSSLRFLQKNKEAEEKKNLLSPLKETEQGGRVATFFFFFFFLVD